MVPDRSFRLERGICLAHTNNIFVSFPITAVLDKLLYKVSFFTKPTTKYSVSRKVRIFTSF